jgi:hypothetical protein
VMAVYIVYSFYIKGTIKSVGVIGWGRVRLLLKDKLVRFLFHSSPA